MRPITIVELRDRWFVCLKPPKLLTVKPPKGSRTGEDTLLDRLRQDGQQAFAVHRLDRETTGLVLMAKDPEARDRLMDLFRERSVEKRYLAVVQGRLKGESGVIERPIEDLGATARISSRGQKAKTSWKVVERFPAATLVEAIPHTGRHNQIRLHFADRGHPLAGERKFARGRDARVKHKRAALHAAGLRFRCPFDASDVAVEAPLPIDLSNLLDRLRSS